VKGAGRFGSAWIQQMASTVADAPSIWPTSRLPGEGMQVDESRDWRVLPAALQTEMEVSDERCPGSADGMGYGPD